MHNVAIRAAAKAANVYLWQIADEIGITDNEFSRRLRYEFPEQEQARIIRIIEEISSKQEGKA